MRKKCVLHIGCGEEGGVVKHLDKVSWKRLQDVVAARKKFLKVSKYDHLLTDFPTVCEPSFGYHSSCWKNFTAIPKPKSKGASIAPSKANEGARPRPSREETRVESSTGVLPKICIFCGHVKHKNQNFRTSLDVGAEAKIRQAAKMKKDQELLLKIGSYDIGCGRDFTALEAKYHKSCYDNYLNPLRSSTAKHTSKLKKKATASLCQHVDKLVLKGNVPVTLKSLLEKFKDLFLSFGGDLNVLELYTVQNMRRKLEKHRGDVLSIVSDKCKNRTIVYKTGGMSLEEASDLVTTEQESSRNVVRQCARILRRDILTSEKKPLDTSTVDGIMEGEVSIPQNVNLFYKKLYNGEETSYTHQRQRFINSSAADAVYCCSGTKLLPGKHISHALALKSLTGSKRVVTLEQRYGHCASNETIRRVEMGLQESLVENMGVDSFVPEGVIKRPGLCTGVAFDNFDVNIETLNGLGTIHHTYGIIYQNITEGVAYIPASRKRKDFGRQFSKVKDLADDLDVEPYYKKPKITEHDFHFVEFFPPASYSLHLTQNLLWSVAKPLHPFEVPMWHGWNSLKEVDINPQQKVMYLQRIRLPPTRNDVVRETMRRAMLIAQECGEKYGLVTYDLAVAKIAKQIQSTEAPQFDDLFIMFGSFHVEMSFFGSLGRMIEGSGGPFVLSEVDIVAPGSMAKFLRGKMYNRCRRVHILMSTAMHALHFQLFMTNENISEETMEALRKWVTKDDIDCIPECLETLSVLYQNFCEDTMSGVRGKTAQFWITYCHLIDLYLLFHGAMKRSDVDLFGYVLHQMTALFFSTNHLNYGRWMSRYALELLNLDVDLKKMLLDGSFSVRRSNGSFCRVGVDMALEQTINAEAKHKLKGIIAFADVNTSVNRLSQTPCEVK